MAKSYEESFDLYHSVNDSKNFMYLKNTSHKSIEERMEDDLLDKQKNLFQGNVYRIPGKEHLGWISEEEFLAEMQKIADKFNFDSQNFVDIRSLKTIHFNVISAFVNSEPNDMELGYKIRQYFNETVKASLEELKNDL